MAATFRCPRTGAIARATALAVALALAATGAVSAAEDPAPGEDGPPAAGVVTCDAPQADDGTEDGPYLVDLGAHLTCTASGLDPAAEATWLVEVFGTTRREVGFTLYPGELPSEPTFTLGPDGPVTPEDDGRLTFSFALPEEVVLAEFVGTVRQGDPGAPTYTASFRGLLVGFTVSYLDCVGDGLVELQVVRRTELACLIEFPPGAFTWEVHELSEEQSHEGLSRPGTGGGPLGSSPVVTGTGTVDGGGRAWFAFTPPLEGDVDTLFIIASQEDAIATEGYRVALTPERPAGGTAPQPAAGDPVTVVRPSRVDAGGGGTAPRAPALVSPAG
jgi:hypothetical protein